MKAELVWLLVLFTAVVHGMFLKKPQLNRDELLNTLLQRRTLDQVQQTEQVPDSFDDGSIESLQKLVDDLATSVEQLQEAKQEFADVKADVEYLQTELNGLKAESSAFKESVGQTYIRWGSKTCPYWNEFVYTGYMAGSKWDQSGGGSNQLCLPHRPSWGNFVDGLNGGSEIRGTEIEVDPAVSQQLFGKEVNNEDLTCSVCRSNRTSQVMIPGRTACYDGWTTEYSGYIVASKPDWAGNSDYVCLDSKPDFAAHGEGDDEEHVVKPVEVRVKSLPGPPYVDGRELPCVVCTK